MAAYVGREELQSINDELGTVNQELKGKVEELGRANSDLHVLMGANAIATIFLDRELRIVRYTPSAVDLFSLIPTDIGRPLGDLTHRLDYPEVERDARRALGELMPAEREVQVAGGWYLARTLPYRSADHHIGGVVLTLVDITARRQAEDALRELQAEQASDLAAILRLQELSARILGSADLPALLKPLLDATVEMQGADFGCVQLYDSFLERLDVVAQHGFDTAILPRFASVAIDESTSSGRSIAQRRRVVVFDVNEDERYAPMRQLAADAGFRAVHSTPLFDRNDAPLGVLTTHFREPHQPSQRVQRLTDLYARQFADVIAFKLAEQSLRTSEEASRASEERLRLVIENAREYAIFSADLDRRITSWNSGAERLIGYSESEAIGLSADVIFTPEDRAAGAPEQEANVAFIEGRAADERWHVRKDGSRFWGSGSMMAMHDANNRTFGILKIFRDQTAQREVNEALERSEAELTQALQDNKIARDALEAAGRAKDRFLAVLSHELRTPLTPVVMAVHTLARRTDIPDGARDALEMIRRNVKIESHLIDDLLDLTRVSRGKFEVIPEPMDLHAAIKGAVEICESDIRGNSQTLEISLDAVQHDTVGDPTRLQQVVWNLLKNASKFTRQGGLIRLSTRNENDRFFVSVSDNGIGIEHPTLPTVFEAFTQGGEWVAREFGGLGLGLAISKATVDAHGGTITAESAGRGKGATFIVELPLVQPCS